MYGDLSHDERKAQTVVRDSQSTIRDPFDYIRDREKAVGSRCRDLANLAGGELGERPACSQPATRRAASDNIITLNDISQIQSIDMYDLY